MLNSQELVFCCISLFNPLEMLSKWNMEMMYKKLEYKKKGIRGMNLWSDKFGRITTLDELAADLDGQLLHWQKTKADFSQKMQKPNFFLAAGVLQPFEVWTQFGFSISRIFPIQACGT